MKSIKPTPNSKKFILYGVVLLILVISAFIFIKIFNNQYSKPNNLSPTSDYSNMIVLPPVSPVNTSSWISYTDSAGGFSFKYPPLWKIGNITYSDNNNSHSYSILNYDANIHLTIGNDLGGECNLENKRKIRFFGKLHDLCYLAGDGKKLWSNLNEKLGSNTLTVSATAATQDGIDTVNTILSTFQKTEN